MNGINANNFLNLTYTVTLMKHQLINVKSVIYVLNYSLHQNINAEQIKIHDLVFN